MTLTISNKKEKRPPGWSDLFRGYARELRKPGKGTSPRNKRQWGPKDCRQEKRYPLVSEWPL